MAEGHDVHWSAGVAGCGVWLLLLAIGFGGYSAYLAARFDPDDRCREGETGRCISVESGTVESTSSFYDRVTVSFDDGRQQTAVSMADGAEPPVGARVRLERWDGDIVALFDPRLERRYKTYDWPERWNNAGLGFLLLAVLFFLPSVVYAAISKGKPWRLRSRSKSRR